MVNYKFKRWILMFSHTGSEAAALVEGLRDQRPNMPIDVMTNNHTPTKYWPLEVEVLGFDRINLEYKIITPVVAKSNILHQRLAEVNEPTLVTLHGYNRIIPSTVLANPNLEIYNLHPGDVMTNPSLRGKDPQEKAIAMGLASTGVMLHRVTEELDGGPLYGFIRHDIKEGTTLPTLVANLKEDALNLWFPFMISKLNEME